MTSTSEVRICCGDAVGTLSLTSGRVDCQGQDVSTTEFERMGGRASSKKWKQSVRVISDHGTVGKLIGDWLMDRGLDIKNNRVIKLDELASTSQNFSIVPNSSTQSHSPVDVRRELATPVNSKMHSVFSGTKPIESGQMHLTLQHSSQSQISLQHQQQLYHEPTPVASAATLSNPPLQTPIRQGPAQQQKSQAQGASSESLPAVAALSQPAQAHTADLWASCGMTPLQPYGQGPLSTPLKRLPANEHPVTSFPKTTGLQTQQPQRQSELPLQTAPVISAHRMQVPTEPAAPPTAATTQQSASALAQAQIPGPTPQLAAAAAGRFAVQTLQQGLIRGPQADAPPATQQVSKQMLPNQMLSHLHQAQPAGASQTDLLQHLQLWYPGLVPGDSTAELPKELVSIPEDSSSSTRTTIDMATATEEELMAMSGNSAEVPLRAMFPVPPGIVPGREAHMTGHRPLKRQRPTIVPLSSDEAAAQIGQYMAGGLESEPWHAFGLGKAPTVAGRDLNLKQLYKAVQSCGGFASCVANRSFAKVTTKLGIDKTAMTNASFLLRNHYAKFLLAYEQQMQILASADGAATEVDEATLDASSRPTNPSGLAAGHEGSAGEEAEARSSAAPGGWSCQGLPGEAVTLIQDSEQEATGRPPLQNGTAVPTEPGALSLDAKAILETEVGVKDLESSKELLADAHVDEATPVKDDAAAGGLETARAQGGFDDTTKLTP